MIKEIVKSFFIGLTVIAFAIVVASVIFVIMVVFLPYLFFCLGKLG